MTLQAGIDLHKFWDAVRVSSGTSFSWETACPFIFNQDYETEFAVDHHCKDFGLGRPTSIFSDFLSLGYWQ